MYYNIFCTYNKNKLYIIIYIIFIPMAKYTGNMYNGQWLNTINYFN